MILGYGYPFNKSDADGASGDALPASPARPGILERHLFLLVFASVVSSLSILFRNKQFNWLVSIVFVVLGREDVGGVHEG